MTTTSAPAVTRTPPARIRQLAAIPALGCARDVRDAARLLGLSVALLEVVDFHTPSGPPSGRWAGVSPSQWRLELAVVADGQLDGEQPWRSEGAWVLSGNYQQIMPWVASVLLEPAEVTIADWRVVRALS